MSYCKDRLERRAETWAEEAKVGTKKQQNIAENDNIEAEKALSDTLKTTLETKETNNYDEEAKPSAEEAMVILLKLEEA